MAITPGDLIRNGILNSTTYGDLNLKILDMIQTKCLNVDVTSLPSPFDGVEKIVAMKTVNHICGGLWGSSRKNDDVTIKMKIHDDYLQPVQLGSFTDGQPSENTVAGQLQKFLIDRGVWQLTGDPISFKGMINYVNVISAFLSAKLMLVGNSFSDDTYVFYDLNNSSFPSINDFSSNIEYASDKINYTKEECITDLNNILSSITNKQNMHYAKTEIIGYCSSCSSSSSSSCSSSSSTYIVYMDI